MIYYIARRIAYAIPIAFAVSIVCFLLVQIAPGDPISSIIPPDAPQDVYEQAIKDYGLDKPIPVQYLLWLEHVVQGDLGKSIANRRPVAGDLLVASRMTFLLASPGRARRLCLRRDIRWPCRRLPRFLDRPALRGHRRRRRFHPALLAGDGAGHHFQRRTQSAACGRRRARRAGSGTGTTSGSSSFRW